MKKHRTNISVHHLEINVNNVNITIKKDDVQEEKIFKSATSWFIEKVLLPIFVAVILHYLGMK